MTEPYKFFEEPTFENPTLIVGWQEDGGRVSPAVTDYLQEKIKGKVFCEIEPAPFFSMGGVAIKDDVALFPENKFYYGPGGDLLIFRGGQPQFEPYRFLNTLLDVAQHYCKIKELFTISSTISAAAHTQRRRLWAVYNQAEIQDQLRGSGLEDMTWEGPPAISSYLLWAAKRRDIAGVSLWPETPFYLAGGADQGAIGRTLAFFEEKFHLNLDLEPLEKKARAQNAKIAQLREEDFDVERYIQMLESGLTLSSEEQVELTQKITEFLED